MDPIELLELCRRGAYENVPDDVVVPRMFSPAEFEACWRTDPTKVRRILDEALVGPYPGAALELMGEAGVITALFPELVAIRGLGNGEGLHKDVWQHTKEVVAGTPPLVEVRWGALMHDIGKARTRVIGPTGKVTFNNHDIVGAKMLDKLEKRLRLFGDDDALFVTVRLLVLNHLRPAGYKPDEWTDSSVRRLLVEMGGMKNFERLMHLSRADLTTKNSGKRDRALERGHALETRVKEVYAQDNKPKLPKGTMGLCIELKTCPNVLALNSVRAGLEKMMSDGALPLDKDATWYATEGTKQLYAQNAVLAEQMYQDMQDVLNKR